MIRTTNYRPQRIRCSSRAEVISLSKQKYSLTCSVCTKFPEKDNDVADEEVRG